MKDLRRHRSTRRIALRMAALLLAALAGCADLRVSTRAVEPGFDVAAHPRWRFAREPLAGGSGASALSSSRDARLRQALIAAARDAGYELSDGEAAAGELQLDYTLIESWSPNARGPSSPQEYLRASRPPGMSAGEGLPGDHMAADAALARELRLRLALLRVDSGRVVWEGEASAPVLGENADGAALTRLLERLGRSLLQPLAAG